MIDRIIDFSVRNKFLVLLLVAAAAVAGVHELKNVPLDAIPDLGDTQVIVYSRWDRSPDIVEAQVTYPIVTAMLGAPHVRAVRGVSDFGYSYVYVIFEDGTDTYWARTRTLGGALLILHPYEAGNLVRLNLARATRKALSESKLEMLGSFPHEAARDPTFRPSIRTTRTRPAPGSGSWCRASRRVPIP